MLAGVEVREHQGGIRCGRRPHFDQFDPPLAIDGAYRRSFFAECELTHTTAADGTSISGSWRDRLAAGGRFPPGADQGSLLDLRSFLPSVEVPLDDLARSFLGLTGREEGGAGLAGVLSKAAR